MFPASDREGRILLGNGYTRMNMKTLIEVYGWVVDKRLKLRKTRIQK